METFMDWFLIYRSENEMVALQDEIDSRESESSIVYFEPAGKVTILEIIKK